MKFSERMGFRPVRGDLEESAMPGALRNGLWDACTTLFFSRINGEYRWEYSDQFKLVSGRLWFEHYREPIDMRPESPHQALQVIRSRFFNYQFYDVYDFVEYLASLSLEKGALSHGGTSKMFAAFCNKVFERERAAFRFASNKIVRITNEEERKEIENALDQDISGSVGRHIATAVELYSRRENPDYRNSIKESISAVESAIGQVLGKKIYGVREPLKILTKDFDLHPALSQGTEKLYAYTSDAGGIRHAMMSETTITQEDARFMLISCSAFANYVLSMAARKSPAIE